MQVPSLTVAPKGQWAISPGQHPGYNRNGCFISPWKGKRFCLPVRINRTIHTSHHIQFYIIAKTPNTRPWNSVSYDALPDSWYMQPTYQPATGWRKTPHTLLARQTFHILVPMFLSIDCYCASSPRRHVPQFLSLKTSPRRERGFLYHPHIAPDNPLCWREHQCSCVIAPVVRRQW